MERDKIRPEITGMDSSLYKFTYNRRNSALLIMDMQYLCAHKDYGLMRETKEAGFANKLEYLENRLKAVIPRIRRLQDEFRKKGMEVIHVRNSSLTMSGRDRSVMHKDLGILAKPGSKESQFLESIGPIGNEIIINKTSSSAFSSTNIGYVLRNIGIESLFMSGILSSVEATARDAYENGFHAKIIEDACCAIDHIFHVETIKIMRTGLYGLIAQTEPVLKDLEKM